MRKGAISASQQKRWVKFFLLFFHMTRPVAERMRGLANVKEQQLYKVGRTPVCGCWLSASNEHPDNISENSRMSACPSRLWLWWRSEGCALSRCPSTHFYKFETKCPLHSLGIGLDDLRCQKYDTGLECGKRNGVSFIDAHSCNYILYMVSCPVLTVPPHGMGGEIETWGIAPTQWTC